jgi:DNA-binding protein HU-beta
MTKIDLVRGLSDRLGMLNNGAESVIDSVLEDIVGALKQGERVNISGFGTFAVLAREARTGRSPQTGESIEIPASRTAKFKPGKQMKESLSGAELARKSSGSAPE